MSGHDKWMFRIDDIFSSIREIEGYVEEYADPESLYKDLRTYRAVERNIEIIAEASKHIPKEVKQNYTDINWSDIVGMRNILAHDYNLVDYEAVWNAVQDDIPFLEKILKMIVEDYK